MINKTPRKKLNKYARRQNLRDMPSFIVIAVEGDRVEPKYFEMVKEKFKEDVRLEIIPSNKKSSPKHILENLTRIKNEYDMSGSLKTPESFWMVCDVDRHDGLHRVIKQVADEGFRIAISNPCFEVWLFAHLAEIRIEEEVTQFCQLDKTVLFEVNTIENAKRNLSKNIKNILDEVRPKKGASKYEDIYFDRIDVAIEQTQKNLKNIRAEDFLVESKYVGQTRVGELLSEIKKKVNS